MMTSPEPKREIDWLQYRGNAVPRVIRFVWTLLFIFGAIYLSRFMWPDLRTWLNK